MKKLVSILLAGCIFTGILSGCSNPAQNQNQTETASQQPTESQTTGQASTEPQPVDESKKWYVSDKPVEITVFFRDRTDYPIGNDMLTIKTIEEKTNIRFKWQTVPWDGYNDSFNIMMSSPSNVPDLIIHTYSGLSPYVEKGAFAAIGDLINEDAPNLQKIFDDNPKIKKDVTFNDLKIYILPQIAAIPNELTYMIRKDWLDKLGLQEPKTTEDWVTVMKAFRDNDMNGNGINDEIPYTFTNKFAGANLFEAFGIDSGVNAEFFMEDGQIKYGPADPRMKDYLTFANMLYNEKLMDPEYLTVDTPLWESRMTTSQSGITIGFSSRIDRFNAVLQKDDPNAQLIGLLPPVGPSGKPQTRRQLASVRETGSAAISVNSKYKKEIVKMFDFIYSEEGMKLLNFGLEGETYTGSGNDIKYTDAILKSSDGKAPADMLRKNGMAIDFPYQQSEVYENAFISDEVKRIRKEYVPYIIEGMPKLKFTKEEQDTITPIMSEINTYKDEWLDTFVLGKKPISEFDSYIAKLNDMGIQKVLDIYNNALARYNAN